MNQTQARTAQSHLLKAFRPASRSPNRIRRRCQSIIYRGCTGAWRAYRRGKRQLETCYVIPDDPEKYGELVGTRAGNVPEVCRRIAEELGVEVEFVEYATLEAQLQAVADGDVDLAADNFTITEERLALYEMTDDFNVREIEGDEVF